MAVKYRDYYGILGVPRGASDDDIKRAYRRLARQYHPDVAKDKRAAEEKFKEINEAYEVLGNPEHRRKYDQLGADWRAGAEFRPPPGWERRTGTRTGAGRRSTEDFEFHFGGTGFSDFFESLFGHRGNAGHHSFSGAAKEAADDDEDRDRATDLLVALDEVVHGSVRTVGLQRVDPADGSTERDSFQVRIPPGVREGQLIRVAGKGRPSPGGNAGDLYLRVKYARHPSFRVRDRDLLTDLTVAPWDAVLGETLKVPTLEGSVYLRVPPGSRNGRQLRLRGRGLPSTDGTRGDLYVTLAIDVPSTVTPEEKALWEQLADKARTHAGRD